MSDKVHYIQPYDLNKNIGRAINAAILQLNADAKDWICLTDHDVLWLLPNSKRQLEEILAVTDYRILAPVTNRLATTYQLHHDAFNEDSITAHGEIALHRHMVNYGKVEPFPHIAAAFCLCFRVSTWEKLGRFIENSIQFDSVFSARALNSGMKIGLMTGIYLFHLYRWQSKNPKTDYWHLLAPTNPDSDQPRH